MRSFATQLAQQFAARGSSTPVSRSDIRLIQHLDSSAHGLVRRWRLIGYFPIHLFPPAEQTRHIMRPFVADGMMTSWAFPFLELGFGDSMQPFHFGGSIFPENWCAVSIQRWG